MTVALGQSTCFLRTLGLLGLELMGINFTPVQARHRGNHAGEPHALKMANQGSHHHGSETGGEAQQK